MTLYNLVRMYTATTGTDDIVVTTAVVGYKDCTDVPNGAAVTYSVFNITSGALTDSEIGHGTWNSATSTIARTTVLSSTNGNAKIVLTGSGQVALTVAAEDIASHDAATVADTTSLNLSITGQEISGAVNFGTGAGVAAEGNHAHAGVYEPADATIVKTGNASWVDLTDGGATTLHSHAGGGALPVADTQTIVSGSADATKLLRFEVDSFTTGTTRVITPPNADITLAGQNYANIFTQANTFNDVIYTNNATPAMKAMLGGVPSAPTAYVGLWLGQATPGNTNFTILSDGAGTFINAPSSGSMSFRVSNVDMFLLNSAGFTLYTTKFLYLGNANQHYIYPGASDLYLSYSANWYIRKAGVDIGVIDSNLRWGMGTITPAAKLHVIETTTTTNAIKEVARIEARVSTAATGGANGFGASQTFYAETATDATYQQQGLISASWIDATNATRKAKLSLSAYDTAARLGLEIEASGTVAKLGFFGGTTAIQQVLNAYTSDAEGGAYTGIDNAQAGTVYATVTDLNTLRTAYETLRASYDDLRTKLQTSTLVA